MAIGGKELLTALGKRFPLLDRTGACYVVGGAIRDLLAGREPVDVDLACDAPQRAASDFAAKVGGRVVDLGREKFVTFRVAAEEALYDFTELTGSIQKDLARRDFTMNALALDLATAELLDPYHGADDVARRVIRMVSEENFVEDPLRIVKGVRMAVTLDFPIEASTIEAMRRHGESVVHVAVERVHSELETIVDSRRAADGARLLREIGVDRLTLGASVDDETLALLEKSSDADAIVRWVLLMRGRGHRAFHDYALKMRWSERAIREVTAVLELLGLFLATAPDEAAVSMHDRGYAATARATLLLRILGNEEKAAAVDSFLESHGAAFFDARPLLSGHHLQIELGIPAGKKLGELKKNVFAAQLRGEISTREEAIALARSIAGR